LIIAPQPGCKKKEEEEKEENKKIVPEKTPFVMEKQRATNHSCRVFLENEQKIWRYPIRMNLVSKTKRKKRIFFTFPKGCTLL
jgi:hypothetical protein